MLKLIVSTRYDFHEKKHFDGKLGIWPLVEECEAKRDSCNRSKGTILLQSLTMDRALYKKFLLEQVIPSIKQKWPIGQKKQLIYIQQDNAKPHLPINDPDIVQAGTSDGWNIRLRCQPPNSPDLNVLDLGYLNALQSMQLKEKMKTTEELVKTVIDTYNNMNMETLDDIFVTLQKFMEAILIALGTNRYKKPHLYKWKSKKSGVSIYTLECDSKSQTDACTILQEYEHIEKKAAEARALVAARKKIEAAQKRKDATKKKTEAEAFQSI